MDFAILLSDIEDLEHALIEVGGGILGLAVAVLRLRYIASQIKGGKGK